MSEELKNIKPNNKIINVVESKVEIKNKEGVEIAISFSEKGREHSIKNFGGVLPKLERKEISLLVFSLKRKGNGG